MMKAGILTIDGECLARALGLPADASIPRFAIELDEFGGLVLRVVVEHGSLPEARSDRPLPDVLAEFRDVAGGLGKRFVRFKHATLGTSTEGTEA